MILILISAEQGNSRLYRVEATVKAILTNQFYRGDNSYQGEVRPGTHEPIISNGLYERVNQHKYSDIL